MQKEVSELEAKLDTSVQNCAQYKSEIDGKVKERIPEKFKELEEFKQILKLSIKSYKRVQTSSIMLRELVPSFDTSNKWVKVLRKLPCD